MEDYRPETYGDRIADVYDAMRSQRAYQQAWVFGTRFLLAREATALRLADGVAAYDPLVTVGGLPCFPDRPRRALHVGAVRPQLGERLVGRDMI
jgi:hypothetical protein